MQGIRTRSGKGVWDEMADAPTAGAIRDILEKKLHLEVPGNEAELIESGLLDSLAFVELVYHLEQLFGLMIDLEAVDVEDLRTVDRIASFVQTQQGPPAS